ncbi:hypothetical protein A0H76_2586 [Hepatospora eriocheir]|uniref:Uncharacterized protein n=1 Tax=Hepatospora eriocheir TaxID=1081669 RepID=A0A1X0QJP7_9MICR|nr:hypothetical protein A0H76_2586 [Hepatospora eriocheir]
MAEHEIKRLLGLKGSLNTYFCAPRTIKSLHLQKIVYCGGIVTSVSYVRFELRQMFTMMKLKISF